MFKRILAAALAFFAASVFAAVDVNKATQADLESIKGIGPVIATKILDERKKGRFKDWNDMVTRVNGIGEGTAARFSAEGLTVNGTRMANAPAAAKEGASTRAANRSSDRTGSGSNSRKAEPTSPTSAATETRADAKASRAERKADEQKAADRQQGAGSAGNRPGSRNAGDAAPAPAR